MHWSGNAGRRPVLRRSGYLGRQRRSSLPEERRAKAGITSLGLAGRGIAMRSSGNAVLRSLRNSLLLHLRRRRHLLETEAADAF